MKDYSAETGAAARMEWAQSLHSEWHGQRILRWQRQLEFANRRGLVSAPVGGHQWPRLMGSQPWVWVVEFKWVQP